MSWKTIQRKISEKDEKIVSDNCRWLWMWYFDWYEMENRFYYYISIRKNKHENTYLTSHRHYSLHKELWQRRTLHQPKWMLLSQLYWRMPQLCNQSAMSIVLIQYFLIYLDYKLAKGRCYYSPNNANDCCLSFNSDSQCASCTGGLQPNPSTGIC